MPCSKSKFFRIPAVVAAVLCAVALSGCEFFMTPQERSGVNPKPFNSQTYWESDPYGSSRN